MSCQATIESCLEQVAALLKIADCNILSKASDFHGGLIDVHIRVKDVTKDALAELDRKRLGNERKLDLLALRAKCLELRSQYMGLCTDNFAIIFGIDHERTRMNLDGCIAYSLLANTDNGIACMCCYRLFDQKQYKAHKSHLISRGYLDRIKHNRGCVVKGDKNADILEGDSAAAFKIELQCTVCDNNGQSTFENIPEVMDLLKKLVLEEALDCHSHLVLEQSDHLYRFIVINCFRYIIAHTHADVPRNCWEIADAMRMHALVWMNTLPHSYQPADALNVYAVPMHRSAYMHLNSTALSSGSFLPMRNWPFHFNSFDQKGVIILFPPFAVVVTRGTHVIDYLAKFQIFDSVSRCSLRLIHSASQLVVGSKLYIFIMCAFGLASSISRMRSRNPQLSDQMQEYFAIDFTVGHNLSQVFANEYDVMFTHIINISGMNADTTASRAALGNVHVCDVLLFLRYFYINYPRDICPGYFDKVKQAAAISFLVVNRMGLSLLVANFPVIDDIYLLTIDFQNIN